MLQADQIVCGYGKNIVLDKLSFRVEEGKVLCILGANGIGKTTLFKSILGHIRLIGGTISVHQRNIATLSYKEKAKEIAYVPQAHIPAFPFQVIDVVAMGRTAHLSVISSPSGKDLRIADEALKLLNIYELRDKAYTQISGGERQLVLIARALTQETKLIIMDEPTANLDFGNQTRIIEQMNHLAKQGHSILYTTHDPEHAFLCSNQVMAIRGKGDVLVGDAKEIITNELLSEIYHVNALVKEVELPERTIRVCIPV